MTTTRFITRFTSIVLRNAFFNTGISFIKQGVTSFYYFPAFDLLHFVSLFEVCIGGIIRKSSVLGLADII
jgi:hypothetical protein